jgi:predicted phosphodiesterase
MPIDIDSLRVESRLTEIVGIRVSTSSKDGLPVIETHKTTQIKTLAELMEAAKIDPEIYEPVPGSFVANVWNVFSNANGNVPLWQVKAKFQPKVITKETVNDLILKTFKAVSRAFKLPIPKTHNKATGKMVLIGVPDLHLGKLAWAPETGHGSWDCKIAKQVWEAAIDDLLSRSPDADECWFPIGNDFFNVDSKFNQTTNGTPQDEDGRWQKTFDLGIEMTEWAIARCRKKFPKVKVILVYGNHDHQRTFYLGKVLERFAKYTPGVEVDAREADRKYFKWGQTGLGFAHGDRLKEKDLATLCQNEARDIWGKTTRFELILGHVHNSIVKTMGGVLTRWLAALCPPDLWHVKSGYTMAEKSATALVYNQRGMENQLMHYPDPKAFE